MALGMGSVWGLDKLDHRLGTVGYDDGAGVAPDGIGDVGEVGDDRPGPALLDEAAGRVDLRAHRPAGEVAPAACPRRSETVTVPSGSASGAPKRSTAWGTSVPITRTSADTVRASSAAPRSLSITASTPRSDRRPPRRRGCRRRRWRRRRTRPRPAPARPRRRRSAAAPARRPASPALLTAVLPGLAVLDETAASSAGEEPADRLGRPVEAGSSASTRARVTTVAVRRSTLRSARAASSAFISTKPRVAWSGRRTSPAAREGRPRRRARS